MNTTRATERKTISVLIPTLGRSGELINTVSSLAAQTVLPDEVIVLDQNNPWIPEVDEHLKKYPWVKHVHSMSPGYAPNLNVLLKKSSSDVVLFLDDDVLPDSKLIEAHLSNYQSNDPKLGAVAGRVEQRVGDLDPDRISEFAVYKKISGKVVAHFNAKKRKWVEVGIGANMSFLKKALIEINGFDESFGGNGFRCESDAFLRLRKKGYRVLFDPAAQLKHLMAPSGGCRVPDKAMLNFHFVKNGILLYRKHSPKGLLPFFAIGMLTYSFAKSVYNKNPNIIFKAIRAVSEGLTQNLLKTQ